VVQNRSEIVWFDPVSRILYLFRPVCHVQPFGLGANLTYHPDASHFTCADLNDAMNPHQLFAYQAIGPLIHSFAAGCI